MMPHVSYTGTFNHTQSLWQSSPVLVPGQSPQPFLLECNPSLSIRNPHSLSSGSSSLPGEHPALPLASQGSSGSRSLARETSAGKRLCCSPTFGSLWLTASKHFPPLLLLPSALALWLGHDSHVTLLLFSCLQLCSRSQTYSLWQLLPAPDFHSYSPDLSN